MLGANNMIEVISQDSAKTGARIIVVGVGGAGNNAVNRMIDESIYGVEYVGINTDEQALATCKADKTITIGAKLTGGKGAGSDPEVGAQAAEESADEIASILEGYDMVFVTAGMGGGTGTGAAPVIARIAKEMGLLTVAVVTKPFPIEGKKRMEKALAGIDVLKDNVDTIIVIPNEKLIAICDKRASVSDVFLKADEVLQQAVQGITDLICSNAMINVDFADVCKVMKDGGVAHVGIGVGTGEDKALEAIKAAANSPLLETSIADATDILGYISGDVSMQDYMNIGEYVADMVGENIEIKWGLNPDENVVDECRVTLIAAGIEMPVQTSLGKIVSSDKYKAPNQRLKPIAPMNMNIEPQAQPATQAQVKIHDLDLDNEVEVRPVKPAPATSASGIYKGPRTSKLEEKKYSMPNFMMKRNNNND